MLRLVFCDVDGTLLPRGDTALSPKFWTPCAASPTAGSR